MGQFRVRTTQCCGVMELADISSLGTPAEIVRQTAIDMAPATGLYARNPAFLMFSGVVGAREKMYSPIFHADRSDDYGAALAEYIKTENLGTVTETPLAKNHSGNMLRVWLWAPRWEALESIWKESRKFGSVL